MCEGMCVCVCMQSNGNNRRQVGHPNGIIVIPWRGTKVAQKVYPGTGGVSQRGGLRNTLKPFPRVSKRTGPILYERHGWPINAKITKLTTWGHRALSCPPPFNPFGLMLLTRDFPGPWNRPPGYIHLHPGFVRI